MILIPLLNHAVIYHDYIVSLLRESDMIMEHWWMTVTGENGSMWRKPFLFTSASIKNLNMHWPGTKPGAFAVKRKAIHPSFRDT